MESILPYMMHTNTNNNSLNEQNSLYLKLSLFKLVGSILPIPVSHLPSSSSF
jgi:hypothetical protein